MIDVSSQRISALFLSVPNVKTRTFVLCLYPLRGMLLWLMHPLFSIVMNTLCSFKINSVGTQRFKLVCRRQEKHKSDRTKKTFIISTKFHKFHQSTHDHWIQKTFKRMPVEAVYKFIKQIEFRTPRLRRDFFQNATKAQIAHVEEGCLNLIKNPAGLSDEQLGTAEKHKKRSKADPTEISHTSKRM